MRERSIFINGKFCAQPLTGVQRVASETVLALDELSPREMTLLYPRDASPPRLRHIRTHAVGPSSLPLHVWEQVFLPWAARGGLLVNLAGAAPALGGNRLCVVHDAAVFDHPEAYTPAFRRWYRWLFQSLARRGVEMATVSAFSRGRLARALGVSEDRFTLLHNGGDHLGRTVPDPGILERLGLVPGRFLLAVGSANPTKNLEALVRAFARVSSEPAMKLVIVGDSRPRVFADHASPDGPGVLRTGPLGDTALKALYGAALSLVYPSLYEGFGLPPLEAMACGCPVAAARAGAIPEVCGDAALYFDPRSEDEMTVAMQTLIQEPELRERLRDAGRARVQAFAWKASAQRLLDWIGRIQLK